MRITYSRHTNGEPTLRTPDCRRAEGKQEDTCFDTSANINSAARKGRREEKRSAVITTFFAARIKTYRYGSHPWPILKASLPMGDLPTRPLQISSRSAKKLIGLGQQ